MKLHFALFFWLATSLAVAADIYKWTDADGKVQYSDKPPKNAITTKISGGVTVIPALVVPPQDSATASSASSTDADTSNNRGGSIEIPRDSAVQASPSIITSKDADTRAELRQKFLEQCLRNRGADCEREADEQAYGPSGRYVLPQKPRQNPSARARHPELNEPKPAQSAPDAKVGDRGRIQSPSALKQIGK